MTNDNSDAVKRSRTLKQSSTWAAVGIAGRGSCSFNSSKIAVHVLFSSCDVSARRLGAARSGDQHVASDSSQHNTTTCNECEAEVMKLLVLSNCDGSMRKKDWRCRKRETQAT